MLVEIPVSVGELIDKITILEIKYKATDNSTLYRELTELRNRAPICPFRSLLSDINHRLWDQEHEAHHGRGNIDKITVLNNVRSDIKAAINEYHDSEIREVKSY